MAHGSGVNAQGDLKPLFAPAFPSGKPAHGLPFDTRTVKAHFLKLRAALTLYYEGAAALELALRPRPADPE